jgi:hypothetical protein
VDECHVSYEVILFNSCLYTLLILANCRDIVIHLGRITKLVAFLILLFIYIRSLMCMLCFCLN